ncbi:MAG: TIGR04053 family radical SAM/SPASM domain-containing protein [Myxococcales bacterium]|nr:TIGR04053 family radical SAM/SPASM domain-containing protein [Myxococcales bacterium]
MALFALPPETASRKPHLFDNKPFMAFWEVTRACDLVCKHCRACAVPERNPFELSTDEGTALLDSLADMGVPLVVITGGDPAKREDLVDLVRHGASTGMRMALTPSATRLVTLDLLRDLRDAGLARLAVSLDGAKAETHDGFRGMPGSFSRTFEILHQAKSIGLTTQINTSVTRGSLQELDAIADLIRQFEVELWGVFFVVPTGRATSDDVVDGGDVEEVLLRLANLRNSVPFDIKTTAAPHFRRVLMTPRNTNKESSTRQAESHCTIKGIADGVGRAPRGVNDGSGILFIAHNGDVYPSGFLPVQCGNVRRDSIADIYRNHPLFRSLRDGDALQGKCGACEFRYVCGGSRARAYSMLGHPLASDPACSYVPRGWIA